MAATDECEDMLWEHTVQHNTEQTSLPLPRRQECAAGVIFQVCVSDLLLLHTPNPFLYFQVKYRNLVHTCPPHFSLLSPCCSSPPPEGPTKSQRHALSSGALIMGTSMFHHAETAWPATRTCCRLRVLGGDARHHIAHQEWHQLAGQYL